MLKLNSTKAAAGSAAERTCKIQLYIANVKRKVVQSEVIWEKNPNPKQTSKTRNKEVLCVPSASVEEIYALSPSILGVWLDMLQLMEKNDHTYLACLFEGS